MARAEQLPPPGDWSAWYLQGGRGSGKTRAGAETLAEWIASYPPGDWGVISPTFKDCRDVCFEGPSGLLRTLRGRGLVEEYNRAYGIIRLVDGGNVFGDGANEGGERIQGKNLRGAWCDEVGLWKKWQRAWHESLAYAVRLDPARIVATGTPKLGHGLVRLLIEDDAVPISRMSIYDNLANLAPGRVEQLKQAYEGTQLGRQELLGEFIQEVEGALWKAEQLDTLRVAALPRRIDRVVVGVDPAVSYGDQADETGIVVAMASDRAYYVVDDRSCKKPPDGWARQVAAAYEYWDADLVVAEKNNGGELVREQLKRSAPNLPVKLVHASKGKFIRAEPIAGLYGDPTRPETWLEYSRVRHVGEFRELEFQMTTYAPGGVDIGSPDRLDALVWAMTELSSKDVRIVGLGDGLKQDYSYGI